MSTRTSPGTSNSVNVPVDGSHPAAGSSATRRTSIAWPVNVMSSWANGRAWPLGDADLHLDQVDAGDRLGHRMLDLESGVDLEERDDGVAPSGASPTMNSTVPAPT